MVGGNIDYRIVVTRRIRRLESELFHANQQVEELQQLVGQDRQELDHENSKLKVIIEEFQTALDQIEAMAANAIIGRLRTEDL